MPASAPVERQVRSGFSLARVVRVRGVDTQIKHEPPPGVVPVQPRASGKSGERHCLVVETVRPPVNFSIHNDTGVNLLRGLVERVFFVPSADGLVSPPLPDQFGKRLREAFVTLSRSVPVVPVLTQEQFIATYDGDRRRADRYREASKSLELLALRGKDSRLDTFVKCEKINFTKKTDPAPRVIQPRRPRFGLEFGRYIKSLEHVLYRHMGRVFYGHPCVAKGYNAVQTARILKEKWDSFKRPVAVSMDASRFDQHVSVDALQWSHAIYRKFFPGDTYLNFILGMMLDNKGIANAKDAAYKYNVRGRRMSGDMDTALGNCLLMVSMTWQLCSNLGIPHHVMDNGDDIVVIFEQDRLAEFQGAAIEHFRRLGFTMVVEDPVYHFEAIDFCQTSPVWNGVEYVMCRGIHALSKDLTCTVGTTDIRPWLHAVGQCGLALTSGLPVFQEFYMWCCRNGVETKIRHHPGYCSGMSRMAAGLTPRVREVTEEARFSFYLAFGILPDMQESIEAEYRRLTVVGSENEGTILHNELSTMYAACFHRDRVDPGRQQP